MKRYLYILMTLWTYAVAGLAQEQDSALVSRYDSVQMSILTCTPGKDLYTKFGHTALRVRDIAKHRDWVFNYGCFNYNADNFVWKFILGQTDYLLEAEEFKFFMYRYAKMGVGVTEQVLNLTPEEAHRLLIALLVNLQPEHQEYRYKWLGVNCTNMVQYQIETLAEEEGGKVVYQPFFKEGTEGTSPWGGEAQMPTRTVRDLLHEKLAQSPWASFGIDMILGHEIDGFTWVARNPYFRQRELLFIPSVYMETIDRSQIALADGETKPYVSERHELMPATYAEPKGTIFTPMVVFVLLLLVVVGVSAQDFIRRDVSLWLDTALAVAQGLAGVLVAFLFFFSEHPGVDSNWLVVIFNPLPLFYAAWLWVCRKRQRKNRLAVVNVAVLAAFWLTMWLCPQVFAPAMYVLVLTLLARATIYYILEKSQPQGHSR